MPSFGLSDWIKHYCGRDDYKTCHPHILPAMTIRGTETLIFTVNILEPVIYSNTNSNLLLIKDNTQQHKVYILQLVLWSGTEPDAQRASASRHTGRGQSLRPFVRASKNATSDYMLQMSRVQCSKQVAMVIDDT